MTANPQGIQIRGFETQVSGTYVLLDDVVSAIRAYAQSFDDPNAGALIHELASWIGQSNDSQTFENAMEAVGHVPITEELAGTEAEPEIYGASEGDDSLDLDRIEIFPDPPDDPRPKWYARMVDTGGFVMNTTNGSFDQEWVIKNAEERWPGKPIHLLNNAGEDSKWVEDGKRGVFPSFGPPVRRLWVKT